jgi:hypothetical protein
MIATPLNRSRIKCRIHHLLHENYNHDLKDLFKRAVVASIKSSPLAEFYAALVSKGIRPERARLTLAQKIATIL